jgi:hypothetical protein
MPPDVGRKPWQAAFQEHRRSASSLIPVKIWAILAKFFQILAGEKRPFASVALVPPGFVSLQMGSRGWDALIHAHHHDRQKCAVRDA